MACVRPHDTNDMASKLGELKNDKHEHGSMKGAKVRSKKSNTFNPMCLRTLYNILEAQ